MLKITLYKNCKFNNKYQEVMSLDQLGSAPTSVLEYYLGNLDNYTIQIDTSYYENKGELIFERTYNFNIYQYNYMKILEYDENDHLILTRYCFVNNIECKNGCVYLTYEEDIWHSYYKKINDIQNCELISSRLCNYNNSAFNYKKLYVEYDGNNIPVIDFGNSTTYVQIILELQIYKLVSSGSTSGDKLDNRESLLVVLHNQNGSKLFDRTNLEIVIKDIAKYISSVKPKITISTTNDTEQNGYYYDLGNIYIIPQKYDISNYFNALSNDFSNSDFRLYTTTTSQVARFFFQELYRSEAYKKHIIYTENISLNYKLLSIGTFSSQFMIDNNGSDIDYNIAISYGQSNFNVILEVQNKDIDLTNDFIYTLHYDLISSEINSQRKIALQLKNNAVETEVERNYAKTAGGVVSILGGIGNLVAGAESGSGAALNMGFKDVGYGMVNFAEGMSVYYKLDAKKIIQNKPQFATSKGNITSQLLNLNYFYGVIKIKINPDNTDVVKKTVDCIGYKTFKYVGNLSNVSFSDIVNYNNAIQLQATYDCLKFDSPNVIGEFPNEIANKLNSILETGIRIWYSPTFDTDNYTDNLL